MLPPIAIEHSIYCKETDFALNRLYIELYDRLLGLDYSRYRRGNPADSVVKLIGEINEITRIKYTRPKSPTSATWLLGFLKAQKPASTSNHTPTSLKNLCLQSIPNNWTHSKEERTMSIFGGSIPAGPLRASLLAHNMRDPFECHDIQYSTAQIRQAQRAATIAQAALAYLDKDSLINLWRAIFAKDTEGDTPDTYRPLLIPIPPASVFREGHRLIPLLIKPRTHSPSGDFPNTRATIFQGASEDHNLARQYVGSPHPPGAYFPILSEWMRPYNIEKWPQEHHSRRGPALPRVSARSSGLTPSSSDATLVQVHPLQGGAVYISIPGPINPGQTHQSQDTTALSMPLEDISPEDSCTATILDSDQSYTWAERGHPQVHTSCECTKNLPTSDNAHVHESEQAQNTTQDLMPHTNRERKHSEPDTPQEILTPSTYHDQDVWSVISGENPPVDAQPTSDILDTDFTYTWSEQETQDDPPNIDPGIRHNNKVVPILSANVYVGKVTPIQVIRCYASLAFKNKSMGSKNIGQIYDISRDPEICLSQACTFPRHGPDMGFTIHTLL